MRTNKITVLAVGGAFALGMLGANAMGDDVDDWGQVRSVQLEQDDNRDDERDERQKDDRRIDGARDDDVVDVEQRDEDDDDSSGGDTNSGGTNDGAKDNTGTGTSRPTGNDSVDAPSVVAAPAPAPAPVYDDYSDDGGAYYGGSGGSDYGDS